MVNSFDVIIIGGSYAGMSCALALGRSLRKVLILDFEEPCNRFAPHAHNFLGSDDMPVEELRKRALNDLSKYETVKIINELASNCHKTSSGFEVITSNEKKYYSRKLVIATGIRDELEEIPGLQECWGISAIHCPYCHGYEYHSRPTGIIIKGSPAIHHAQLISNWSNDVYLFTNGDPELTEERIKSITDLGVKMIETPIRELKHNKGYLKSIITTDGMEFMLDAVYVSPTTTQQCTIPVALGCELDDKGLIGTDSLQRTNVDGVYACGDCNSNRSLAGAVYTGSMAGASVNNALIDEGIFAAG